MKEYRNTLTHWAFDSKSFHFLLAFLEFSVFTIFVWGLFSLFLLILKRVSGAETRGLFFEFWVHAFCFQPIRNQLQARKKQTNNLSRTKFKVSLKKILKKFFCRNCGSYFGFENSPQRKVILIAMARVSYRTPILCCQDHSVKIMEFWPHCFFTKISWN